jgi:hypothetical protein
MWRRSGTAIARGNESIVPVVSHVAGDDDATLILEQGVGEQAFVEINLSRVY